MITHHTTKIKPERTLRLTSLLGICTRCCDLTDECQCSEAEARARRRAEEHREWKERNRAKEGRF